MADAPKTEAAAAEAPAKKKPLVMIAGAVLLAVVLATGGGVYFFVGGKSGHAEGAEKADAKDGKREKSAPKEPAQYVKLDPPFVVNFEAKGLMRFLQVAIEVMTRDSATAELLKKHDPMIRNDLIMLFGNQQYESISTREGKEQLRAEALKTVAKVIAQEGGDGKQVEQLFFTSFVMQ